MRCRDSDRSFDLLAIMAVVIIIAKVTQFIAIHVLGVSKGDRRQEHPLVM